MATTTQYSFYQVASADSITSVTGYSNGAIVYNKTRKEFTIFDAHGSATVYGGGIVSASFANQTLTLVDSAGSSLTVNLADFTTTSEVTGLLANYYNKLDVNNLLEEKADAATTLSGYGITDAYTKKDVDDAINGVNNRIDGVEDAVADMPSYEIRKASTADSGYSATYQLYSVVDQTATAVGAKINIPKDMVVQSGAIEVNPSGQSEGTYIVLTLANATNDKLYINVTDLIDVYTGSTYISVKDGVISLNISQLNNVYATVNTVSSLQTQVNAQSTAITNINSKIDSLETLSYWAQLD